MKPLRAQQVPAERDGEDTRARLLAAARDVFVESGPANFSLREVARRVGVSAPAIYRHFQDRDALVFAACTQGFHVFSSYLVRSLSAPTPLSRLVSMAEQYRLFAQENPVDYRFMFMGSKDDVTSALPTKPGVPERDLRGLPQLSTFQFLVDRVRECIDVGAFAAGDAHRAAVLVWAHVHGLVSLRLAGHLASLADEEVFSAFYRSSVERLIRGMSGD